eukprot:5659108-Pyramimonas_sp.AAC.1
MARRSSSGSDPDFLFSWAITIQLDPTVQSASRTRALGATWGQGRKSQGAPHERFCCMLLSPEPSGAQQGS